MTRYSNGYVPSSALVTIATGTDANGPWKHQGSPHIIAIWRNTQAYAQRKWGKTPKIRTGWNMYRPYAIQVAARQRACAAGNCLGAASPGYSSHGGTWVNKGFTGGVWVDALAIDVDPNGLTWDQVYEAARANGFLCGAVTAALAGINEPWHIIDLSPWAAVPADSGGSTPFPVPVPVPTTKKEQPVVFLKGPDAQSGGTTILVVASPGVWDRYAVSFEDALKSQYGSPVILSLDSMAEKKAVYLAADDATVAAIRAIPAASLTVDAVKLGAAIAAGIKIPSAAENAAALLNEQAKRLQA